MYCFSSAQKSNKLKTSYLKLLHSYLAHKTNPKMVINNKLWEKNKTKNIKKKILNKNLTLIEEYILQRHG